MSSFKNCKLELLINKSFKIVLYCIIFLKLNIKFVGETIPEEIKCSEKKLLLLDNTAAMYFINSFYRASTVISLFNFRSS